MINLNKTYGIEIEFLKPTRLSLKEFEQQLVLITKKLKSSFSNNTYILVENFEDNFWYLKRDTSVQSSDLNYEGGFEISSAILKGLDGLNSILQVLTFLKSSGCIVNKTCGLHVHHYIKNQQSLENVCFIYRKYSSKFNKLFKSRVNNQFAKSFKLDNLKNLYITDKYHVLNIDNFFRLHTAEFRQSEGTLEFEEIKNWIEITQKIVIKAEQLADANLLPFNLKWGNWKKELYFTDELNSYVENRMN